MNLFSLTSRLPRFTGAIDAIVDALLVAPVSPLFAGVQVQVGHGGQWRSLHITDSGIAIVPR